MKIDELVYAYKNCFVAYEEATQLVSDLEKFGVDTLDLSEHAKKIKEIGMNEVNKYQIIDKKNLTQLTVKDYYDNFDIEPYSASYINCNECHFETCVACVANLIENLYNYDDEFKKEFDENYSIIKLAENKEK